jgi:hypothetical protein
MCPYSTSFSGGNCGIKVMPNFVFEGIGELVLLK